MTDYNTFADYGESNVTDSVEKILEFGNLNLKSNKTWVFILFFIILLIILVIISVQSFIKKRKVQEGIDWPKVPSPEEIGNKMKSDFDEIGRKAREVGTKMEGGFKQMGDEIGKPFKELAERFKRIGTGFEDIFGGIGDEFLGLGEGLKLGFEDIGRLIEYTGEFILTYCVCGVKYITNLSNCFFYYMIDVIIQILYLPVRLFLFIIWAFLYKGVYKMEALFWKYVNKLDNLNFSYTGFYVTRWPLEIRNLCYNCKRLKVQVLKNKAQDVNDDFDIRMPQILQKGVNRMKRGGNELLGAFR
jgi:hypothetical protein